MRRTLVSLFALLPLVLSSSLSRAQSALATTTTLSVAPISTTASACAPSVTAVAAGDFNNDGNLDVVVAGTSSCSSSAFLTTMLGNGNGTFTPSASLASLGTASTPTQIVAADFNGDGNLDIAVLAGTTVYLALGNGDGTFQSPVSLTTGGLLAVGNFTGSGLPDLAVTPTNNNSGALLLSVLPSQGNGTFGAAITTSVNTSGVSCNMTDGAFSCSTAMVAGDLNNDGITDIALAIGNSVIVLLGEGNGSFQAPSVFQDGDQSGPEIGCGDGCVDQNVQSGISIALADLSGSGNLDIVVGSEGTGTGSGNYNAQISVLPGNGTGSFPSWVTYSLPNITTGGSTYNAVPSGLVAGDFSYTGNPGILALGYYSSFLLAGSAGGSLQAAVPVTTLQADFVPLPGSLDVPFALGDFANDGNIDSVVPTYSANSQVLSLFEPAFLGAASLSNVTVPGSGVQQVDAGYSGDSTSRPAPRTPSASIPAPPPPSL